MVIYNYLSFTYTDLAYPWKLQAFAFLVSSINILQNICQNFASYQRMNSDVGNSSGPRPMSVEAIAKRAGDFEYNARIPLRQWLRAADTLQKEVHQKDMTQGRAERKNY